MSLVERMAKLKLLPRHKLLEFYPPFLFMGVKIKSVSKDGRRLHATLPLRWYGKNLYGTMFGGFMCAIADPLPALMCSEILPDTEVWTKSHAVDFLKPGKGKLDLKIEIREDDLRKITDVLAEEGKTTHTFEFSFWDQRGHEVAHVRNTVFFRKAKNKDKP